MTSLTSSVPPELRDKIVLPGDGRYRLLRSTYTTVAGPAAVLLPENTAQVAAALRYARERGLPVSVRSGGHGLSGRSSNDGGVVIDLSAMNRIEVIDRSARIVRVEAGARWAHVARALAPYGLAISSGDHGNVGVGGLATGGGVGWLVRHYGLTIDHIRAAEVVLADGPVVRADAEHEPDLLWAVRGAGAGAGIVVAFEIEALGLREVGYAQIAVGLDPDGRALRRWADYMASAPRELSTAVTLLPYGDSAVASITAVVAGGSERRLRAAVEPLRGIGAGVLDEHARLAPYPALVSTAHLHPNVGQQPVTTTNGLLVAMTDDDAAAIMAMATGPHQPLVQMRSLGGAVNDMPADATAYAHRRHGVLVIGTTFPPRSGRQLDAAWRPLAGRVDGAYVGFESRPGESAFARIYPGATGDRVRRVWRRYDPDGVFQALWRLSPAES
ncbi:FAD-binding protein [Microbispora rosea subsp. aerata]|nr:FAD-dependent oxidoreductase [Microbispora rosea]GGO28091.1 FAD-binding protein [Microbispora rosea subsp. aerata]GIH56178.1 FAD-binding protein [Microbispora rosea subsp. aerata]GLJ85743.1 FAD-binding protein [Microbispora rosea subsp. aerata]